LMYHEEMEDWMANARIEDMRLKVKSVIYRHLIYCVVLPLYNKQASSVLDQWLSTKGSVEILNGFSNAKWLIRYRCPRRPLKKLCDNQRKKGKKLVSVFKIRVDPYIESSLYY